MLREMVEPCFPGLSVRVQCELLGLHQSSYYYDPSPESPENLRLMLEMDRLHLEHPVYGIPRITAWLRRQGWKINRKRVVRLMQIMDLEAIYPRGSTDRKSTRLNSSHIPLSRMPSSA